MSGRLVNLIIFFPGKLDLAVSQYFVHILSLVTDKNPSCNSEREANGHRNYSMINLHESMGLGWDQTHDGRICN